MFEQMQLTSEQLPSIQVPIEVICRELGDMTLGMELYDENVETRMDAEDGKNPNPQCPHGNDIRACTVCNSRNEFPKQQLENSASSLDDYMLAA